MRRVLCLVVAVLLVGCGAKTTPALPPAATDAVQADAPAADSPDVTADPWLGAPPALCRTKTSTWSAGQATFTDITQDVGAEGVAGIRLSLADLNGDLYPELLVRHMAIGQRDSFEPGKRILTLLENQGKSGSWTFQDTTQASGITQTRDGKQGRAAHILVCGDVDNDGDLDVFAGNSITPDASKDGFPKDSSELMLNDGQGHFALTTKQTFGDSKLRRQLSSASFTDYDRDGWLDLWLGYTTWTGDQPMQNPLLRGDGLGGFSDVTAAEGLTTKTWSKTADIESGAAHRNTWGTAACDLDDDGLPDLLTVSYGRYFNGFWWNGQADKRFVDAKDASHLDRDDDDDWTTNWNAQCWCKDNPKDDECDKAGKPVVNCVELKKAFGGGYRWNHPTDRKPWRLGGNTGTAVCADLDRDGDLDLVETTITHPDVGSSADPTRIVRNDGKKAGMPPLFTHLHGDQTGLVHSFPNDQADDVGDMTAGVLDFDGDGRIDILVASSDYPGTHAMLFHQLADGTYEEVPVPDGIDHKHAHGVAIADFDRDGDLDVLLEENRVGVSIKSSVNLVEDLISFLSLVGDEDVSIRCRKVAEENFSMGIAVEKYLSIYDKMKESIES